MRHPRESAVLLSAALLGLGACSGGGNDPSVDEQESSSSAGESRAQDAEETSTEPAGSDASGSTAAGGFECEDAVCLNPAAKYADFDTQQELSVIEQALMREPGPYAGEAFDAQTVYDVAKASEPANAREWSEAILTQMHPDYAQPAQDVITFNPVIEGLPDEPVEEYRDVEVVGANHFAIVLDASGSMNADSAGESRMSAAQAAIEDFVGQLPEGSTVSLRVYGQDGSNAETDKEVSCASTEVVYEGDQSGLGGSMDEIEPVGWTPLALAVQESVGDIPQDASDAIVYVVTDGIETCGGDPVAETEALSSKGIEPVVNVIGFEVGDADTEQLRAMAEAGGGQYTDVDTQADLERYWEEDMQAMMRAWSDWQTDALKSVNEQGRANMDRANESGQAVMDTAIDEFENSRAVVRLMQSDDSVDYDTHTAVWRELYDRHNTIWSWGYDGRNANWSEAYDQQTLSWSNAYDLGNNQWSEYYQKKSNGMGD